MTVVRDGGKFCHRCSRLHSSPAVTPHGARSAKTVPSQRLSLAAATHRPLFNWRNTRGRLGRPFLDRAWSTCGTGEYSGVLVAQVETPERTRWRAHFLDKPNEPMTAIRILFGAPVCSAFATNRLQPVDVFKTSLNGHHSRFLHGRGMIRLLSRFGELGNRGLPRRTPLPALGGHHDSRPCRDLRPALLRM